VVYFLVIAPVNALAERISRGHAPPSPTKKTCPECLSEVPIAARRCAFCTQPLPPVPPTAPATTAAPAAGS